MSTNERNPGRDISLRSRHETVDWALFFFSKIHLELFGIRAHFLLIVINRLLGNSKVASVFNTQNWETRRTHCIF